MADLRQLAAASPRPHAGGAALSHHPENPSAPPSVTRGRALTTSGRTISPRSQTPVVLVPSSNSSPDRGIERKPSLSYGHHRQTSIVHGIQHSRNTSFVNSPATSPLSPQAIAASASVPLDGPVMSQENISEAFTANGVQGTGVAGNVYTTAGATASPSDSASLHATATRRPERVQSGRSSRKGHHHHRSQSRHHHHPQELKTVGEYALHHLFNSVSRLGLGIWDRTNAIARSLSAKQTRRSANA